MPASFILFALFSFESLSTVWIKPSRLPFYKFKAHVKASGDLTFAEYQYKKIQKDSLEKFPDDQDVELAQKLYLSGRWEEAKNIFSKISQLSIQAEWPSKQRETILYSFLRQIQIEQDKQKRQALLLSAKQFYIFPIKPNHPQYQLFPAPLIEEFNLILSKQAQFKINWNKIFPFHEIILVNGRHINKNKEESWAEGRYFVTALSSSHEPWSKNIQLSELLTRNIKSKKLTKGLCEDLKIRPKWKRLGFKLLPPKPCKPASLSSLISPQKLTDKEPKQKQLKKKDSKKWLWISVGTITGLALIYYFNKDDDDDSNSPKTFSYF